MFTDVRLCGERTSFRVGYSVLTEGSLFFLFFVHFESLLFKSTGSVQKLNSVKEVAKLRRQTKPLTSSKIRSRFIGVLR